MIRSKLFLSPNKDGVVGGWAFLHQGRWLSAQSPGCIHTDLQRHGLIRDPFHDREEQKLQWIGEQDWIYRTTVRWPRGARRAELVAHGLDTLAEIRLDGRKLGSADNMFRRYTWDAGCAADGKDHRLEVVFRSVFPEIRRRGGRGGEVLRKSPCNFGWDWGPRLVTCGFFRPVEWRTTENNRLSHVHVEQTHGRRGVRIDLIPQLTEHAARPSYRTTLRRRGRVVAVTDGLSLEVAQPELWWPRGHGAQALYDLSVELREGKEVLSSWRRRIGLRTVDLDRRPDRFGECFRFVVNGVPIFAKGADWIPAHVFPHGLSRRDYEPLLRSAVAAHMNMIRCWGGGIYEHKAFYDVCDELGLLVWQEFVFANALYPGTRWFLDNVAAEAVQQVQRLQHRACLALWCGSNEVEQSPREITKTGRRRRAGRTIFSTSCPEDRERLK